MANWYGLDRTNYFRVKDEDAFEEFRDKSYANFQQQDDDTWCAYSDGDGWPCFDMGDNEIDFVDELRKHVADDDIIIFVGAGHEKARYCTGYATAYGPGGESVSVNIDDIYELAKAKFGKEPTRAEY